MSTFIVSAGLVDSGRTIGTAYVVDKLLVYGFGNFTTVSSGGSLCVENGGRANQDTVSNGGYLYVFADGYASSNTIKNGGFAYVTTWGSMEKTTVSSGGSFAIAGTATVNSIHAGGRATVQNGGYASNTIVYAGGLLNVLNGGEAFLTSVGGSNATMNVNAGAGVTSTTVFSKGTLNVSDGAVVHYASAVASSAVAHISSGGTASGGLLEKGGSMQIDVGGSAKGIDVSSGGRLDNYGIASAIYVYSSGRMTVSDGGVGSAPYIQNGGQLEVNSGGSTADGTNQGNVYVSNGGLIARMRAYGGEGWVALVQIESGGQANGMDIQHDAKLNVVSGGHANVVSIFSGGRAEVSAGGLMEKARISSGGWASVLYDGIVSSTTICSSGRVDVFRSGFAFSTTVNSSGVLNVSSGGTATSTTVLSGGKIYVKGGGSAVDHVDVYSGGRLLVSSGGTATDITVATGGYLDVDFDSATCVQGMQNDMLFAGSNGLISDMTIGANCRIALGSGGTAAWTEVQLNGFLHINKGGKVTDRLTINPGAVVSAGVGGVVDFDVAVFNPGQVSAIINDISLIQGTPTYTITVDTAQAEGTYELAGGATGFDQTVSVFCAGAELGSLTVGNTATLGGQSYTLNLNDDLLTLSVGAPAPAVSGTAGDLNMDGRADIVMTIDQASHPADGSTGAWLIQKDQTAVWGDLSTRNAGFVIFGTGKTAAGKNTDDIYIKNSDNLIGAWTTDDGGKVSGWATIGEFDAETQIVGLGDFNGNGQTDLLLRNTNGAVGCFFTGGETTGWNYFQSLGDEWQLSAVGDLNGDGRDDVVLKHNAGFAGSWLTQKDGTMAWADLDTLPDGFEIVGAGDFNGDGTDDVLLKNGNYYGAWLVNNGNAAGWMGLGDLGNVTVEQIADFNADGVDDLRIRTAAGDLGAQLVMGADTLDWHYYGSVGAEWSTSLAALS